jgi:hypothetical protein
MPKPSAIKKYSTLRVIAQAPLPLKYLFSSQRPKKTKKTVALAINILCAVMSFMTSTFLVNHSERVGRKMERFESLRAGKILV